MARTVVGSAVADVIAHEVVAAPDLVNAEVVSVLRRWRAGDHIDAGAADRALARLARMDLVRFTTGGLIEAMWSLRHNLTPYDASYVALARRLGCPLLTLDARLAGAPGLGVRLASLGPSRPA